MKLVLIHLIIMYQIVEMTHLENYEKKMLLQILIRTVYLSSGIL